jgi:soluble lytic murein transglycosylase
MSRRIRTSFGAALAIAALSAVQPAAAARDETATRTEFRVAYAAAQAGSGGPEASDSAALRAYPLYPYLQATRLEQTLQDDTAIGAFLDEHGDAPYTGRLRRLWLEDLARRGRWDTYLARYPGDSDIPTLRCHALAARAALNRDAGLERAIVEQWLTPRSLPDACDPAIDWLRSRKALTADLIERRARMALAAGESQLARYLARSLPVPVATPLLQWAALIERPESSIDELIEHPGRDVEPEALLAGWTVLARRDPDASVARFIALSAALGLDARQASPYALATALGLAWSRRPGALHYFSLVSPDDFDDVAHEWHVRAALWAGDWARAERAIAAMPDTLRNQNRWRYWAARVRDRAGEPELARAGYAGVMPTDNWYAALAAARLGERFTPSVQPIPLDQGEIDDLARSPAFVRVRELLLCDLTSEATTEWRVAYQALTPSQQLQAIGLADRWGWHYQAIAAAAQQTLYNDYPLLYPRPYDAEVGAAARLTNLPPELIYAVIRQESLYRPDAGSSAGALGLMQLLPSTARRAARRWGLKAPGRAELLQPGVNIPIGAGELKSLLDRFDGQMLLATAAYNAGPGAVRRWLPDATIESDIWVENIPFNETRAYVQRVAWHSLVFGWLDDRKPRDTAPWLAGLRLPPADAALKRSGS